MKRTLIVLLMFIMMWSVCSCGIEKQAGTDTQVAREQTEKKSSKVKKIDFSTDEGSVKFLGAERANKTLVRDQNAIMVRFEFVNKSSEPATSNSFFFFTFYQNGVEIDDVNSYAYEESEQYDLLSKRSASVMPEGKVEFGEFAVLTDESPVTIMVKELNGDYQMMELKLSDMETSSSNSNTETDKTEENQITEDNTADIQLATPIDIGEKIETTDFDFTLNKVEFSYEVKPEDTSGVYTSYEAGNGKVYIHVDGSYYNKSKRDVCVRDLFVPFADYNDGYKYEGFVAVDDGNRFTWANSYVVCTPLETCHYHGIIECPIEVESSDAPIFITLKIGDTNYKYNIR